MGLPMSGEVIGKFSLNYIPTLNHKFTIVNSFIIFIWPSIRRQSFSHESFGGFFFYVLGDLQKHFVYSKHIYLCCSVFPSNSW